MDNLFANTAPPPITRFQDDFRWLSNFWVCDIPFEGLVYPSVENAYQAAKFTPGLRDGFVGYTPARAKREGRMWPARSDWQSVKLEVMASLLAIKFAPGTALAARLLSTGAADLVEGNEWGDVFWGVCKGRGSNHLGRLLMAQRTRLQQIEAQPAPPTRTGPKP